MSPAITTKSQQLNATKKHAATSFVAIHRDALVPIFRHPLVIALFVYETFGSNATSATGAVPLPRDEENIV